MGLRVPPRAVNVTQDEEAAEPEAFAVPLLRDDLFLQEVLVRGIGLARRQGVLDPAGVLDDPQAAARRVGRLDDEG